MDSGQVQAQVRPCVVWCAALRCAAKVKKLRLVLAVSDVGKVRLREGRRAVGQRVRHTCAQQPKRSVNPLKNAGACGCVSALAVRGHLRVRMYVTVSFLGEAKQHSTTSLLIKVPSKVHTAIFRFGVSYLFSSLGCMLYFMCLLACEIKFVHNSRACMILI